MPTQANLFPWIDQRFFDENGDPASGYKVYTYIAGSSTPAPTWPDKNLGGSPNSNPIIADSAGRIDMWGSPDYRYKIVLKTAADVTVKTWDYVELALVEGDDLQRVETLDTSSVTLVGEGTVANPLTATVNISSLSLNALSITTSGLTAGLYALDLSANVSALETAVDILQTEMPDKLDKVDTGAQSVAGPVTWAATQTMQAGLDISAGLLTVQALGTGGPAEYVTVDSAGTFGSTALDLSAYLSKTETGAQSVAGPVTWNGWQHIKNNFSFYGPGVQLDTEYMRIERDTTYQTVKFAHQQGTAYLALSTQNGGKAFLTGNGTNGLQLTSTQCIVDTGIVSIPNIGTGTVSNWVGLNVAGQLVKGTLPLQNSYTVSTGLYNDGDGVLSIGTGGAGVATTFSISDGSGYIENVGTVTEVTWTGKTNIAVTNLATQNITFVSIDINGNVIQRGTRWTAAEFSTEIVLGVVVHVNRTTVDAVNQEQAVMTNAAQQVGEVLEGLGFLNLSGNKFTAYSTNLQLTKSAGTIMNRGINWVAGGHEDPHKLDLPALTPVAALQYRMQDGTSGPLTDTVVNPNIWDNGSTYGSAPSVPTNKFTVQRIYSFTSNNVKIQPGQAIYNSLAEAKGSIQTEEFVTEPSIEANGILRGYLCIQQGTTDLSDDTKVFFLDPGKFGGAVAAGGLSVSTMQNTYNNSTSPEIVTDSTRGALTLKRGSAADTDLVFEILNGAGSITAQIAGDGATRFLNTTNSTDYTNGSVIFDGGVGINRNLYVGSTLVAQSAATSVSATTGALQVVGGAGIQENLYVGGIARFQNTTASTMFNNGAVQFSGGVGISGALHTGSTTKLWSAAAATSTTTGALQVVGGAGIAGALYVGGVTRLQDTTASTSATTGALTVTGGVGVSGALYAAGLVRLQDTTDSTLGTGAVVITGGVSIAKKLFVGSTMTASSAATSTSTTTGAFQVVGGAGIGGALYLGGRANLEAGILATNTAVTPASNSQWTLHATSDTNFRITYRGSDGTTRTADITLA